MRTRLIAVVAAILVVSIALFAMLHRRAPRVNIVTAEVTSGAVARQVLATATVEPARTVEVGSQVSGTISSLPVDFNSVVKTGQVVAELDPSTYQSQLDSATAALAQARAAAAQAQTTLGDADTKYTRARELKSQDLIAQQDLDTAQVTFEQAQADLRAKQAAIGSAQANVKQARVDLARTVIRSPIDGVIVNRAVDVGQTVAAAFQSPVLFTIADLKKMQLLAEINEGEVGGVVPGSPVSFQVESLGSTTFKATVTDVRLQPYAESTAAALTPVTATTGSSASTAGTTGSSGTSTASNNTTASSTGTGPAAPGAVTYTAVIQVDNSDGRLTPGATAIVTVSGAQRRDVIRVPNNALSFRPSPAVLQQTGQEDLVLDSSENARTDKGERFAFVWKYENARFVPIEVKTGMADDQWTEVLSGSIQAGDQLVTSAIPSPR